MYIIFICIVFMYVVEQYCKQVDTFTFFKSNTVQNNLISRFNLTILLFTIVIIQFVNYNVKYRLFALFHLR